MLTCPSLSRAAMLEVHALDDPTEKSNREQLSVWFGLLCSLQFGGNASALLRVITANCNQDVPAPSAIKMQH